jgi:hypothetical protein
MFSAGFEAMVHGRREAGLVGAQTCLDAAGHLFVHQIQLHALSSRGGLSLSPSGIKPRGLGPRSKSEEWRQMNCRFTLACLSAIAVAAAIAAAIKVPNLRFPFPR